MGNVKAKRDWSDAEDFVKGIWLMMNQEKCRVDMDSNMQIEEYVLSSNETHTISEFVWYAFKSAGIEGAWHGEAESSEFSISTKDAIRYEPVTSVLVKINPKFYRPAEVDLLLGDSTKARKELGWKPETSFEQLVDKMVKNDIKQIGL